MYLEICFSSLLIYNFSILIFKINGLICIRKYSIDYRTRKKFLEFSTVIIVIDTVKIDCKCCFNDYGLQEYKFSKKSLNYILKVNN